MPGTLLHFGAVVTCVHGGQAMPAAPCPRVLVSGQPVSVMSSPYIVAGCPLNISGVPVPCVSAMWVRGAMRVLAAGAPALLLDSQAVCVPNGTPLLVIMTQVRVSGT